MKIRPAHPGEAEILSNLAVRSEATWGYDAHFMARFREMYRVDKAFIALNPTFVLEDKKQIVGFYSILKDSRHASLEYFYIDPPCFGKGFGRILWQHLIKGCRESGIDEIELVTSPQAEAFYLRMGALRIGDAESLINGRKIPVLRYSVPGRWTVDALFENRPEALALYGHIQAYLHTLGPVEAEALKTQVSFKAGHKFAWVWLPQQWTRKRPEGSITLTFSLNRRIESPRIAESVMPRPGRWTHHIVITRSEDLDDEIKAWLTEAYALAVNRSAGRS